MSDYRFREILFRKDTELIMTRVSPVKILLIVAIALLASIAAAPTLRFEKAFSWVLTPFYPEYENKILTLGLDLQGGLDMTFRVESKKSEELASDLTKAMEILRNRIDLFGVSNAVIMQQGDDQVRIQIPGISEKDQKEIKEIIKTTDLLTFKLLRTGGESADVFALTGRKTDDDEVLQEVAQKGKSEQELSWFLVKKEAEIGGDSLSHARITFGGLQGNPEISLEFNTAGTKKFGEITDKNVGRRLAIVLSGKVYMAPVIKGPIMDGRAVIQGNFDIDEARRVTAILKAGSLPAPLKKLAEITVGPTLGAQSINSGVQAAIIGFILVLIYIVIYYKGSGLIANIALLMDAVMVVAILLFFGATLTLPGIAGLVLTIGMAVDANVIIFERIKEELAIGKSVRAAIDAGFDKAWVTIIDANLTTLLTAIVLYVFGTGAIRGFAVTLSIGIAVSMFTALFVVKVLMDLFFGDAKTVSI